MNKKHGFYNHKFYKIWQHIKDRCNNKNTERYKYYGGKGVTYDFKWNDFLNFKKDMYFKYVYAKKKYRKEITKNNPLSIERKDVNGNYCFTNCEFIPLLKQQKNTTRNKWFEATSPEGIKYKYNNQKEFCICFNLYPPLVTQCLKRKNKHHKNWTFRYLEN